MAGVVAGTIAAFVAAACTCSSRRLHRTPPRPWILAFGWTGVWRRA